MLRIIVVHPLCIAGHNTMQKNSFSAIEAAVQRVSASTHTAPNILTFESFLLLSNFSNLLGSAPNGLESSAYIWQESS